jgi:glycosyltransferase involved in cell wall biosynthesis
MADEIFDQPAQNNGNEDRNQHPIRIEPPPAPPIVPTPPQQQQAPATPPANQDRPRQDRQPEEVESSGNDRPDSGQQDPGEQPAPQQERQSGGQQRGERNTQDPRRNRSRQNDRRSRGRSERSDRSDRPDRQDRPERGEGEDRGERPERSERPDRPERQDRSERPERPERAERSDRGDRPERSDRFDRQGRPPRQGRSDRSGRFERSHDSQSQRGGRELSVVIPVFNEEGSLRELYENIRNGLGRLQRYELIFVDDGSTDGSARVLAELRNRDRSRIKVIRFRRNYGKSAALSVGFAEATGEVVVTMDSDLQDDPAEIPSLMNEIRKGYDLVSGWKKKRRDPITKTIPSRFFNLVTRLMTGIRLHDFNCGLKAYRLEVVKEIRVYGELHRYIPVLAHWMGFKIGEIPVTHHRRKYGKTKFGIGRFWKGFLDLLTVLFTTRYLRRPLHLFGFWGILFFLAGFAVDGWLVYEKLTIPDYWLSNRPLFLGGVLLIIVGIQFISIGLLGEMITKTKNEGTDTYSIRETLK